MSDDKPAIGMLRKHRNGFIEVINSGPLDLGRFETEERKIGPRHCFILGYKATPFEFAIARMGHSFDSYQWNYTRFVPDFREGAWNPTNGGSIDTAYSVFKKWMIDHVKRYIDELQEPDLWAQIQSQTPVVSDEPVGSDDREPFTQPEQVQLRMAIKEFRQLVIDRFETTDEHISLVDDRLDYLAEQVGLLNRINWRSLAFSTLVSITIALSLNNEQGKELFELFKQVFSNIVLLLQQ
ncbi:MAG: hypothetical protein OEV49_05645 [candidate division Zixibacteria bacterium]|nr:hypothetical protein [candidate division Zixibacteria bacterium]MDH3936243.1 hypothetical protein [candidate division Zixibacteria bacterium]MDH4033189.1 hypothetical protein [candidate division Zixibacteria bacterium]